MNGLAGFVAKVLFSDAYKIEKHKGKKTDAAGEDSTQDSLDAEIERMKKGLK